jgi:hypothetical protein
MVNAVPPVPSGINLSDLVKTGILTGFAGKVADLVAVWDQAEVKGSIEGVTVKIRRSASHGHDLVEFFDWKRLLLKFEAYLKSGDTRSSRPVLVGASGIGKSAYLRWFLAQYVLGKLKVDLRFTTVVCREGGIEDQRVVGSSVLQVRGNVIFFGYVPDMDLAHAGHVVSMGGVEWNSETGVVSARSERIRVQDGSVLLVTDGLEGSMNQGGAGVSSSSVGSGYRPKLWEVEVVCRQPTRVEALAVYAMHKGTGETFQDKVETSGEAGKKRLKAVGHNLAWLVSEEKADKGRRLDLEVERALWALESQKGDMDVMRQPRALMFRLTTRYRESETMRLSWRWGRKASPLS